MIDASDIHGYITPESRYVVFSKDSMVARFYYKPIEPGAQAFTGKLYDTPVTTYNATVYYRNRTANSIEIKIDYSMKMAKNGKNSYAQIIDVSCCGVSRRFTALQWGEWKTPVGYERTSAITSTGWFKVEGLRTNSIAIDLKVNTWQANYNGDDAISYGASHTSSTWRLNIPLY